MCVGDSFERRTCVLEIVWRGEHVCCRQFGEENRCVGDNLERRTGVLERVLRGEQACWR